MITALDVALNRSLFSKVKKVLRFGYNITTTLSKLQDPKQENFKKFQFSNTRVFCHFAKNLIFLDFRPVPGPCACLLDASHASLFPFFLCPRKNPLPACFFPPLMVHWTKRQGLPRRLTCGI
jgi:hypothetical protein